MRSLLWLFIPACFANAGLAATVDCQTEYQKHLKTDLNLSYQQFDQTENQGMRALAYAGCAKEAADLIVAYIQHNKSREISLFWHVAQQRASEGNNVEAIVYAKQSLVAVEDWQKKPLRWNDYVKATIAFLEKDLGTFQQHRQVVQQGKDQHPGNAMNLQLLDKLEKNFQKSYLQATAE